MTFAPLNSNSANKLNIGIVGAGITGLTAAYDLLWQGHNVTLYEARPYAGGLAAGFKAPTWDWHLERFYHHIFASDDDIISLVDEIGFADALFFKRPVTSIYHEGETYAMDKPLDLALLQRLPERLHNLGDLAAITLGVLSFKPLRFIDRLRYGAVGAYLRYTPWWKPLETVTAHEWLLRTMGRRAYQTAWEPLLMGKFGEKYYRQVNMAWLWARLSKRTPQLGYFKGGFQAFIDALVEKVREMGGALRLETHVRGIHPEPDGRIRLELRAGDRIHDRVLATCSPQMLHARTPTLPDSYTAGLRELKSMGAVVVVLELDRQVTDEHYWINIPKREGFPFLAFVEHTNYIDTSHYGGKHLVYCGDYLPPEHPYFEMSPESLVELFIPGIQRLNPDFEWDWIQNYWKFSETYAQPVPFIHHSHHIPPLATPIPHLFMANMSQVYPWDRGTNYAVALGREAAQVVGDIPQP